MRYMPPSGGNWRRRAVATLVVIAFLPVLLMIFVRAVNEMARAVIDALGPLIPYAFVILALAGIYRLVLGRRM